MSTTDESSNEALRVENALLRDHLTAAEAECRALHGIVESLTLNTRAGRRPTIARVEIGSRERMAMLEHTVDVLDSLAQGLAEWSCYQDDDDPCSCASCRAEAALTTVRAWRYGGSTEVPSRRFEGAMYRRVTSGWDPRETKIHRAWANYMGAQSADRSLALVLTDRSIGIGGLFEGPLNWPTPRDWYVATSVVQWLATNVGSSILDKAGWKYTQWDEDRAAIEAKRSEPSPC